MKVNNSNGCDLKKKPEPWTEEDDNFLKENYLTIAKNGMATMLDKSETRVRKRMIKLGIVVPEDIIEKFSIESRFKKGSVPLNKGKKIEEYMHPDAIARSSKTRFKSGNLPVNTLNDGVITTRLDKHGVKHKYIRISQANWQELRRYNWEKVYGPIPEGMCIVYKTTNYIDDDVSNLEMISKAQNMKRNSIHRFSKELKSVKCQLMWVEKKIRDIKTNGTKVITPVSKQERILLNKIQRVKNRASKKRKQKYLQKQLVDQRRLEKQKLREQKIELLKKDKDEKKKLMQLEKQKLRLQKKKTISSSIISTYKIPSASTRQRKIFEIKTVDTSQLISVRIDNKTTIYIKPGQDIETARRIYQERIANSKKILYEKNKTTKEVKKFKPIV
jgi:hypothetical protein